jgi:ABC-type transport system involved in multi-copper enzyme maturation permease subunit
MPSKNARTATKERKEHRSLFFEGISMPLGPGPVFAYEWLIATRRWQLYALRTGFVGVILVGMMLIWNSMVRYNGSEETVSIQSVAMYGESFYVTIVSIELSLVLLAAPAATAGAICLDKARGTLDHMLATDLSNAEIVFGKLGVRLVPVLGLIACVLPVAALGGLLGGIDPTALLGSFLTAIGCAVTGCSLALTLSIRARKSHEVLMLTYLLLIIWLISPLFVLLAVFTLRPSTPGSSVQALMEWVGRSNPYYLAVAPYTNPGRVGLLTYLGFLAACVCVSAILLGWATIRVRHIVLKQVGWQASHLPRSRFQVRRLLRFPKLPGPSLDRNPILWREWHRAHPSRFHFVVWFVYHAFGLLWTGLALHLLSENRGDLFVIAPMNMFQVSVGLLLVSVSAATSLAEERVRGSLDVLLATPISTRSILAGKWWGSFQQVAIVAFWPALTTGSVMTQSSNWIGYFLLLALILAYGAVMTSLGLALATWVSRLGHAVALCVSAYVTFSIGWLIFVGVFFSSTGVPVLMILGSPPYGAFIATLAVLPAGLFMPGDEAGQIVLGEIIWIVLGFLASALLFMLAVATFDHCLGRMSASEKRPMRNLPNKLSGKQDVSPEEWLPGSTG